MHTSAPIDSAHSLVLSSAETRRFTLQISETECRDSNKLNKQGEPKFHNHTEQPFSLLSYKGVIIMIKRLRFRGEQPSMNRCFQWIVAISLIVVTAPVNKETGCSRINGTSTNNGPVKRKLQGRRITTVPVSDYESDEIELDTDYDTSGVLSIFTAMLKKSTDCARPHATRIVDELLHDVEHVWGLLGKRVRSRLTPHSNLQQLRNVLNKEWNSIDQTNIQKLIERLNRRKARNYIIFMSSMVKILRLSEESFYADHLMEYILHKEINLKAVTAATRLSVYYLNRTAARMEV
ncbi:hypothetical protein ANN_24817 [Periplaneta americana]|uniref:Uncharacterized protein n=1 Tax=Periplaneta americana TaxID=6978 RepID=A0ABQ8S072_PERAM|nr:hypothetical protein ANN_24817 [Periplaneta americana]